MDNEPWAISHGTTTPTDLVAAGFEGAVEIGRGGFGVVYRCVQRTLDRTVAIKALSSVLDTDNLSRFVREQRAMGRLSGHPNIVDIYDVGVTDSGRPFLVMPFHPRGSLDFQLRQTGPLQLSEVLKIGVKVAGALESAHQSGTLHRDVKPANILITVFGEPQLTDFGIARISGEFETSSNIITGSPTFTAPEVLEGAPPDAKSDVYSLAATVFCLLAGHAPFERRRDEQLISQFIRITTQPIPDLRAVGVPDDVCEALEKAMAKTAAERPETAADFGHQLQEIQRNLGLSVDEMRVQSSKSAGELDDTAAIPMRSSAADPAAHHRPPDTAPPVPVTKFRPPTHTRDPVPRQRLLDALRSAPRRQLTLIHAPAGFGKSTLAAQWREVLVGEGTTVAWFTVDQDDNNAAWFLTHLIEAIRRSQPRLADGLGQVLEEHGRAATRYVLTSLINQIHEGSYELAVVIDDWHRISDPHTRAAVEFLLDNGCHHLVLIVTSRNVGGLPVSRMRVKDELYEIDSNDLSFDLEESREFLTDRTSIALDTDDITALRDSTDGWVAALQLVTLSLRGVTEPADLLRHLSGNHETISEYLAENVLGALEPDVLDFLLVTSIPERICGDLASVLADVPDGSARLEQIAARDLFLTRIDDEEDWFRYHHLFARLLHRRLVRDEPERTVELHRRAFEWFGARHLLAEAIDHALAADEPRWAVDLLESDRAYLLDQSQMATLLGLTAKLALDSVESSPRLQLAIGWATSELQRPEEAQSALNRARRLVHTGQFGDTEAVRLRIEGDVLQSAIEISADRMEGVEALIDECLTRPELSDAFVVSAAAMVATIVKLFTFEFAEAVRVQDWATSYHRRTSGPYTVAYGLCYAGLAYSEQLDLSNAISRYESALSLVRESGSIHSQPARLTRALIGELRYEQNDLAAAEKLLDETFDVDTLGGSPDFMLRHYTLGARIRALHGDDAGAASHLDEGERIAALLALPRLRAAVMNERVRLELPVPTSFIPSAHRARLPGVDGINSITAQLDDETAILLLLRAHVPDQTVVACQWAEEWVEVLSGLGRNRSLLRARRLLVMCLISAGRATDAMSVLKSVVVECAGRRMVRYLLDMGPGGTEVVASLRESIARGSWTTVTSQRDAEFLDLVLRAAKE